MSKRDEISSFRSSATVVADRGHLLSFIYMNRGLGFIVCYAEACQVDDVSYHPIQPFVHSIFPNAGGRPLECAAACREVSFSKSKHRISVAALPIWAEIREEHLRAADSLIQDNMETALLPPGWSRLVG